MSRSIIKPKKRNNPPKLKLVIVLTPGVPVKNINIIPAILIIFRLLIIYLNY
jgi:hypothetical protein